MHIPFCAQHKNTFMFNTVHVLLSFTTNGKISAISGLGRSKRG